MRWRGERGLCCSEVLAFSPSHRTGDRALNTIYRNTIRCVYTSFPAVILIT